MNRRIVFGCLGVLVLLIGIAAGGFLTFREGAKAKQVGGTAAPVRFTVVQGATVSQVGEALEQQGVIRSASYFRWMGRESKLKPGVYKVSANQTPAEMLERFVNGKVDTTKVTFPEGFTVRQMAARLKKNGVITDDTSFLTMVREQGTKVGGRAFPDDLEGYLFPDTYQFPWGSSPQEVAGLMAGNFRERVIDGLEKEQKESGHSLKDVIIVASMIEREAEVEEDRPHIAAVIYNRLKKGMPLQIDATIQYARGQHKERLMNSDLEIASPYNTYKNSGLPPGPICCPGLPSIEAALKPSTSDDLFYVDSGEGTGHHLFAKTYAEHLKNVSIFRKRRAERQKQEQGAPTAR